MAMLKHLFIFMIMGILLYAGLPWLESFKSPSQKDVITLTHDDLKLIREDFIDMMKQSPTKDELKALIESRIDDEILVNEALKLGIHLSDNVIKERLILNMIFLEQGSVDSSALEQGLIVKNEPDEHESPQTGEPHSALEKGLLEKNGLYEPDASMKAKAIPIDRDKLFNKAIAMGMLKSDLVVVRRLKDRMEKIIARTAVETPTDKQLRQYLIENIARYSQGNTVNIFHAFFAKGDFDKVQIDSIYSEWKQGQMSDEKLLTLATSSYVDKQQGLSENSLLKIFDKIITHNILLAEKPSVLDLQESAAGFHIIRVNNSVLNGDPFKDLSVYKDRLLNEYMRDKEKQAIQQQLIEWRKNYSIHIASIDG